MREATLAAIATTTLVIPRTQGPLVERVRVPKLLLSVCKGTLWVLTATGIERFAQPRLRHIWNTLKFCGAVREGTVLRELADPLQVVGAVLRLPKMLLQRNARAAVVPCRL